MKIAICEDEMIFAQELATHVQTFFHNKNMEFSVTFYSDEKILQVLDEDNHAFDIIFMDINLKGKYDGVEISKKLRAVAPFVPIIFITSLENRAIDGYDVDAFGFLVKKKYTDKLPLILEKLWSKQYEIKCLTVTEKEDVHVIPIKDILWIESEGRRSLVHTIHETYTDIRSIQNFSAILSNADFIECFKSIFVNIEKIKSVSSDTVTLINDHKLPVSRRSRKGVMLAVMEKVRNK